MSRKRLFLDEFLTQTSNGLITDDEARSKDSSGTFIAAAGLREFTKCVHKVLEKSQVERSKDATMKKKVESKVTQKGSR
jgi:hypothetical protein